MPCLYAVPWLGVEGSATTPNLIVRLDATGAVQQEIPLPADIAAAVTTKGFEGVAEVGDNVWVAIKKIYEFDVPATWTGFPTVRKRLVKDLLPALRSDHGWVQDKVEGLTIGGDGRTYAVTDNDALDDATGETLFLRLGKLL